LLITVFADNNLQNSHIHQFGCSSDRCLLINNSKISASDKHHKDKLSSALNQKTSNHHNYVEFSCIQRRFLLEFIIKAELLFHIKEEFSKPNNHRAKDILEEKNNALVTDIK
jgi:hypothetical protein